MALLRAQHLLARLPPAAGSQGGSATEPPSEPTVPIQRRGPCHSPAALARRPLKPSLRELRRRRFC
eukprot:13682234-Alexandrium_andersonii.AAC.1